MLVPAMFKKVELENEFKKLQYTNDMFLETASLCTWIPDISEECRDDCYQYAIMDKDKLIGYLNYRVDWYASQADSFGLISFDKGNPIVGLDVHRKMKELLEDYKLHRISWRMVGGNPAERSYDRFCKKYGGKKFILTDALKDRFGNYHDDVIYEIINS